MEGQQEFDKRISRVRQAMRDKGLQTLLIYDSGRHNFLRMNYVAYLTDFISVGPETMLVLPLENTPVLYLSPVWDIPRAQEESWVSEVRPFNQLWSRVPSARTLMLRPRFATPSSVTPSSPQHSSTARLTRTSARWRMTVATSAAYSRRCTSPVRRLQHCGTSWRALGKSGPAGSSLDTFVAAPNGPGASSGSMRGTCFGWTGKRSARTCAGPRRATTSQRWLSTVPR